MGIQLGATRQHEGSQDFASGMVGVKGVRWKAAPVVLRGRLACASLMEAGVVAITRDVPRVLREAQCIARHMVVESVAFSQGV